MGTRDYCVHGDVIIDELRLHGSLTTETVAKASPLSRVSMVLLMG